MDKSVKDIDEIIAEIEAGLDGRAHELWTGQGRDLKEEAAVRVQRGEATVEEIIAEEAADVHVYETQYFGEAYSFDGEPGPDEYTLEDVRALAEDTLGPGQELKAYHNGRCIAHFKKDRVATLIYDGFTSWATWHVYMALTGDDALCAEAIQHARQARDAEAFAAWALPRYLEALRRLGEPKPNPAAYAEPDAIDWAELRGTFRLH